MKKNNNAGLACEQRSCAASIDLQGTSQQSAEKNPVKFIAGHEVLPHGSLRDVGKLAEFKGGFRFGAGSAKYREMSATIAQMGKRTGHNFYRAGRKLSAQFLLGLPDGEYFGVCYPAYTHDKRLPSVAMIDASQIAANLQYHFEAKVVGRRQLAALTLPGLESRIAVEHYQSCVDVAFKRLNKLKLAIKKGGLGDFLFVQLEAPFDPQSATFYLHFHIFLTLEKGDTNRRTLLDFLKKNTPWLKSNAGLHLKRLGKGDVAKSIRYGTKPSTTAYQIADSGNEEVFASYLKATTGKRTTRSEGALKETLKELKQTGRRAKFYQCETTGRVLVGLVQKRREISREQARQQKPIAAFDREPPSEAANARKNIFCGCGRLVSSPGDHRLRAFGVVQNFCPDTFDIEVGKGKSGSLFEANCAARLAWEMNTKSPFALEDFLGPIAEELNQLIAQSEVQSYTVIASPSILKALGKLRETGQQEARSCKQSSTGATNWTRLRKFLRVGASTWDDFVRWLSIFRK